ncbi:MAG TPA: glycosyltransferase [Candidatus Limnocylindrales bacterium]|nr:glycosyltransferase [Candidatus Limnocylindrales bacterium]
MNIAHITTEVSWRGGEVQLFYLSLGLARKGYTNFLITPPGSALAGRVEALEEPSLKPHLKIITLSMRGEWDVQAVFRMAQILRQEQVHILHMHTAHAVTLGSLAGKIARIPVCILSRRVQFPLRSRLSRFKYQWGIDKIIAVSHEVRSQLLRSGIEEDKIIVIPSGVDLVRFNPRILSGRLHLELKLPEDALLVGVIGYLSPEKGQSLLIQAVPEILKQIPEVKVILVGDGPLRSALQSQINTLGLNQTVYLLGFRSDIPEILADLDILLSTSFSEGSPGTVKEAMALGKPVIALDTGGVRELITHGVEGILIPYREAAKGGFHKELVGELAAAVIALLKDRKKRQHMGQAAVKKIQAYGMDKMVERTEALYLEILRKK